MFIVTLTGASQSTEQWLLIIDSSLGGCNCFGSLNSWGCLSSAVSQPPLRDEVDEWKRAGFATGIGSHIFPSLHYWSSYHIIPPGRSNFELVTSHFLISRLNHGLRYVSWFIQFRGLSPTEREGPKILCRMWKPPYVLIFHVTSSSKPSIRIVKT